MLTYAAAGVADTMESDPGLFMLMMMALVAFGIAFTLGALLCAFLIAIVGILMATGVVSLSLAIGLYSRSLQKGVRWFTRLSFVALSLALAYAATFFLHIVEWLPTGLLNGLCIATLGAIAAGICFDLIFNKVLRFLYRLLRSRLAPVN